MGLTWNQVDLDRKVCWYHPDEMKAGNALGVALNDTAVEVLKRQIGKHKKFVFVNKWNKPISGIN
ncbi:TPA: tyrosine-type recombinase/integrase, partial [Neisseria subflava]